MINLMPSEEKRQIRAARINTVLSRYIIIAGATFLFLLAALTFSYFVLTSIKTSAENLTMQNQLPTKPTTQTTINGQQLQSSLSRAQTFFANDPDYTKALTHLAAVLPAGVVISSLDLSSTTFGAPTTLQILAKSAADVSALQTNLQGSPYFSGVAVSSTNSNSSDPKYPVTASVSAIINRSIAQ